MQLSRRTLKIMKNFSIINPNLYIKKNTSRIETISAMKNVLSETFIDEKFKHDICIYDLPRFLKLINSLSNPDIVKVDEHYIHIKSDDYFVKYKMSPESHIIRKMKDVNFPKNNNYSFELPKEVFIKMNKISESCDLNDLLIQADGKTMKMIIFDKNNEGDSVIEYDIGKTKDRFSAFFKVYNVCQLLPVDYKVTVAQSSKKHRGVISRFIDDVNMIQSYIALEPESVFNKKDIWSFDVTNARQIKVRERLDKMENAYFKKRSKVESLLKH